MQCTKELDGMELKTLAWYSTYVLSQMTLISGVERFVIAPAVSKAPNYQPPEFVVQALQHTNVECTWDEGDRERGRKLGQSFGKWKELNESELQQYLASDSEIRR